MRVHDLKIEDYHDVVNALVDGPSVEATVSFNIVWSGVMNRATVRNTRGNFAGRFIVDTAAIEWSASNANGFTFMSDPGSSMNEFSLLGRERNGVFFPQDDREDDDD